MFACVMYVVRAPNSNLYSITRMLLHYPSRADCNLRYNMHLHRLLICALLEEIDLHLFQSVNVIS